MKKVLSSLLVLVMCLSVSLFTVACDGSKEEGVHGNDVVAPGKETTPKETIIDFDQKGDYSDCFSIDVSYSTNPVKKSTKTILGLRLTQYSSTGTITVKIEPLMGYRIKAEGVQIDSLSIYLKLGSYHPDEYWKFAQGGDKDYNYQHKSVSVTLSANGTATVSESIELDFVLDYSSVPYFSESSLSLFPAAIASNWHGKVHIYND